MAHNRATIYSNGIADFQRVYDVKASTSTKISLPVRQEHLGDVLGSLTISGDVKIVSPPSYQPANVDDGNISIDNRDSIVSLASQLSGAQVAVSVSGESVEGRLLGLQSQQIGTEGAPINEISLTLIVKGEVQRFAMREIQGLKFLDPIIQSEVDKALNRSLREIKPNSTFVELELKAIQKKSPAFVQYTIPAAAWKISYRILLDGEGGVEFHGHAIVDNNTDEDWKDFIVSVVMGQPITFSTDLADSKTPGRSHVNIVQESAFGSVEVEQPMEMALFKRMKESAPTDEPAQDLSRAYALMDSGYAGGRGGAERPSAHIDEAEATETGDFCIFQSANPVSIDAHRSAVIPVFQTSLDDSNAVFYFKEANHAERPYRAIKFKNTTGHSLGRGICTIYDQTTFAGTCVLPATKPDEESFLAHALETGIRVQKEPSHEQNRRVGIKIADGVAYNSHHVAITTNYVINSSRDESLPFVLDHPWRIAPDAEFECLLHRQNHDEPIQISFDKLKNGIRTEFQLLERDVVVITVLEAKVTRSQIKLAGEHGGDERFRVPWLYENIVESDLALADDPNVRDCIEIHKLLLEKNDQILHANAEITKHEKRQERLRKNIQTGGGEQQNLRWQNDLARAEDAIVQLEEEHIPALEREQEQLRSRLETALRSLIIEWNE